MKNIKIKTILLAIVTVALIGCKKDDDKSATPATVYTQLKLNLLHMVDTSAVELDTIKYTNAAGNSYSVSRLRYIISDIYAHKGADSTLLKLTHFVDVSDSATFSGISLSQLANGSFDKLSFIFGLDTVKNVTGYFVNPPESTMAWPTPMGGGYHYMQLEGKYDSASVTKNYNTHTGPTMGNPYHFYVSLPSSSFTASGSTLNVNLTMNISNWYKTPNTYDFNTFGDRIMANPTAQTQLQQNGSDVFSVVIK